MQIGISERDYRTSRRHAAEAFVDDITQEDFDNAYLKFRLNPPLTLELPLRDVHDAYWGFNKYLGEKEGREFLESCERALNNGEAEKDLRQLSLGVRK